MPETEKKKYIVMAQLDPFGDMICEYTGIEHETRMEAKDELKFARRDPQVFIAWIEEKEA